MAVRPKASSVSSTARANACSASRCRGTSCGCKRRGATVVVAAVDGVEDDDDGAAVAVAAAVAAARAATTGAAAARVAAERPEERACSDEEDEEDESTKAADKEVWCARASKTLGRIANPSAGVVVRKAQTNARIRTAVVVVLLLQEHIVVGL